MARLGLDAVTKRYGDVLALEDCTLELATEGFHCVVGPNGSGKTTLLRLLLGLERPTTGTVVSDGLTLGSGFQRPSFDPALSVRENLDVFGRIHGGVDTEWRDRLLEGIRLRPALDRRSGDLSGGFARKLDLALALQHRPDVVLLDEPFGALDDVTSQRILEFLEDYATGGHAVIASTHRIAAVATALDRLTVLREGRVLLDEPRSSLGHDVDELSTRYVATVLEAD